MSRALKFEIIPLDEIIAAHAEAKQELFAQAQQRTGIQLDPAVMTLGFARRATPYKRADLLFSDIERLKQIGSQAGSIQVIYVGKAHPRDESSPQRRSQPEHTGRVVD